MRNEIDFIINSETYNPNEYHQIASGFISETMVEFENEHIIVCIDAKGIVEFYNSARELLNKGSTIPCDNAKGLYEEVAFTFNNNCIQIHFPIYTWIDHYPHCDGEYDRYTTKIIGTNTITYDYVHNHIK